MSFRKKTVVFIYFQFSWKNKQSEGWKSSIHDSSKGKMICNLFHFIYGLINLIILMSSWQMCVAEEGDVGKSEIHDIIRSRKISASVPYFQRLAKKKISKSLKLFWKMFINCKTPEYIPARSTNFRLFHFYMKFTQHVIKCLQQ